jgi:glyoxylate/hydroxypyruvate reductase A
LRAVLPNLDFRVWPDIGDGAEIRMAAFDFNFLPDGVFARMPNLGCIVYLGHGAGDFLLNPAIPKGVPVMRLKDPGIIRAMVEYILLYILRDFRHEAEYLRQQGERRWRVLPTRFTNEVQVGIMGLGSIGERAARVLADLEFRVSAWTRGPHDLAGVTCFHGRDHLATFLAPCDYVVCILPETPETRDIIDERTIALMKRGAYFINVGRGRLVVEQDLLTALESGHLRGAALDVFRTEPLPPDSPFWTHPNVIVTPHDAGFLPQGSLAHVAENYRRLSNGQPLINLADPTRGY